MGTITVRVSPDLEKALASVKNKSAAATAAIENWLACERDSRRRLKNLLTYEELKGIVDVVNGTLIAPALARFFRHEIEDAISIDKIDVKWEFDAGALTAKMDQFSMSDWIVLYQWGRAFWSYPDQSLDEYAKAFLA